MTLIKQNKVSHGTNESLSLEAGSKLVSEKKRFYSVFTGLILSFQNLLKWYYDQKIISFFSSDFESVFAKHPTGKILSFVFYRKAVYFECKFQVVSLGFRGPPLLTFKTDR